jgi:hypothetical protein
MFFLQIARKTKKTLEICKVVRKEGGKIKVGPFKVELNLHSCNLLFSNFSKRCILQTQGDNMDTLGVHLNNWPASAPRGPCLPAGPEPNMVQGRQEGKQYEIIIRFREAPSWRDGWVASQTSRFHNSPGLCEMILGFLND